MHTSLWYPHRKSLRHLSIVKEHDVSSAAQQTSEPPTSQRQSLGGKIAAHLDVGTIVMGALGTMMVLLINMGVGKLDKLTDQMSLLNDKMIAVITRGEWQERKDLTQDALIERHVKAIEEIQQRISRLEK